MTNPTDFYYPDSHIRFQCHTVAAMALATLYHAQPTLQFTTPSIICRKHNLRFGGEFRTGNTNNLRDTYGPGYARFTNTYDSTGASALENFVTGNVDYGYVAVGNSQRYVSQKSFGLFIQDAWRVSSRLLVNARLRYDLSRPITERHDLLANFDPVLGMVQVGNQISQPYNSDYKNFAPRLSFDYDFFGTGKTVLRAGAGIIYEIPHISVFIGQNSTEAQGLALIPTGLPLTDINGNPIPSPGTINATTYAPTGDTLTANWQAGAPSSVISLLAPSLVRMFQTLASIAPVQSSA